MKGKLSIIFATAISFFFVACQKKQYAYVQQGKVDTYAYTQAPKAKVVEAAPTAVETPAVASEEVTTATIANPTESLTASNDVTTPQPQVEALKYDEKSINAEFEKLNKLEEYVNTNEGTTLADVQETELAKDLKLDTNVTSTVAAGDLPLNIPAFWWGCVLGLVGVLVVYIVTDQDKDQTKKALYGCLVWVGVWLLWWIFVVLIGGGSFFF
ncbi:hypothetical protein [Emticicia sp. C21]|uniref:hypothetical protein n=1 Tax=Emticicia sp. C21 TaxID=2302915 RepID=UPI000E35433D|nr:hypothetical protein [Emticicia sp. C21]RFS15437.1 hypothetical protein D0T08_14895 [Emticicia sp. C21]